MNLLREDHMVVDEELGPWINGPTSAVIGLCRMARIFSHSYLYMYICNPVNPLCYTFTSHLLLYTGGYVPSWGFMVTARSCLPWWAQRCFLHRPSRFGAPHQGKWSAATTLHCCWRGRTWAGVGSRLSSPQRKQCPGQRWSSPWMEWGLFSAPETQHSQATLSSQSAGESRWSLPRTWSGIRTK